MYYLQDDHHHHTLFLSPLSWLFFFFFFQGGVHVLALTASASSLSSPSFVLDVDKAIPLSTTGSQTYPPMVSVPCRIVNNNNIDNKPYPPPHIGGGLLNEIIKPPNVETLYDWYVEIQNQPNADPSWANIWPTAITLSDYLLRNPRLVQSKRVIELGSGLGLCGLITAATVAGGDGGGGGGAKSVLLTDREPFALHCALATWSTACSNNSSNNDQQQSSSSFSRTKVQGAILDWCCKDDDEIMTKYKQSADVIIASDVLYDGTTIEAFATVCQRLLAVEDEAIAATATTSGGDDDDDDSSGSSSMILITDPKVERFPGARKILKQALVKKFGTKMSTEIMDLPLPIQAAAATATSTAAEDVGSPPPLPFPSTLDGRDHVERMKEPTVLIKCSIL